MPRNPSDIPEYERSSGGFIPTVRLKEDGESCRLRFMTDYPNFYWERFHRVMQGKDFKGYKICESSAFDRSCTACITGNRSTILLMGWVYESTHDYTEPGENRKAVREGKKTVYREIVGKPRLLRISTAHKGSIQMRLEKFGTLLEREFEWTRSGKPRDTKVAYTLDVLDKLSPEDVERLEEIFNSLPDLEEVALEKVTALNTNEESIGLRRFSTIEFDEEEPF